MASFSDTSFGKDTAFSSGAFDFGTGPAPTTVIGGHFAKKKKHHEEDFTEELAAKRLLREQIRQAIEGPEHVSQSVQTAISEYIRPQKTDSRMLTLDERIDWGAIYRNLEQVEAMVLMHIAMAEDEEDDDFLLLNG